MAKIGKIIAIVVLAIIVLLALAAFAISRIIDPNDYKDEIQKLAHDKANMVLKLDGNIGWNFFPWLGIELNDASIASAATPDKPLAQVKAIGLAVRLLPLLSKDVQMSEVRINGLNVTAIRDANGQTNWDGIGATGETDAAKPDTSEQSSDSPPMTIDIARISVSDTSISYRDEQSDAAYTIDALNITTGAMRRGKDTPVSLSANFDTGKVAWRGKVKLDTTLNADWEKQAFALSDLAIKGEAQKADAKPLPFSVTGSIKADQSAQTLSLAPLSFAIGDLRLDAQLQAQNWESALAYEGKLTVNETNLRQVLQKLDVLPATANDKAFAVFALNADVKGNDQKLAVENLHIKLDQTDINGKASIADLSKPTLALRLSGNAINVDDYLPPASAAPEKAKAGGDQASVANAPVWSDDPIVPVDTLRQFGFDIDASFDHISVKKVAVEKPILKIANHDGLVNLNTLRGNLLGGSFSATGVFDARSVNPHFTVQKNVQNIQLEQLFAGQEKPPIKGKAIVNAKVSGFGNSLKSWVEMLNGTGTVRIDNGVLPDANLEMKLCTAIALLNRKPLSKDHAVRDTAFQRASASMNIKDGVVRNPDLIIALPGISVKGQGAVDLRALSVDYRVGVTIEGDQTTMPDPACTINERYVGIAFPLRCQGPITSGAGICGVDEEGVAQIALKLAGDKAADKALDKLDDKLGDKAPELKDAIKGLFGR
jgi:Uncharacterized protein involved in outer membrane biogenesis